MAGPERFDIAFGQCRVQNGGLVIERASLEELDRWETLRRALAASFEHQPRRFGLVAGSLLLLIGGLVALLVDLYRTNPAAAPIMAGLAVLGLAAIFVPLEWSYRRSRRQRNGMRRALADEFNLRRPAHIPFEAVTDVTVRTVRPGGSRSDGRVLLVHHTTQGIEATTYLGFPAFMDDELATAMRIFERHGVDGSIPEAEAQLGSQ